jgi:hypothetical protein
MFKKWQRKHDNCFGHGEGRKEANKVTQKRMVEEDMTYVIARLRMYELPIKKQNG